jgi:hypothetical protein
LHNSVVRRKILLRFMSQCQLEILSSVSEQLELGKSRFLPQPSQILRSLTRDAFIQCLVRLGAVVTLFDLQNGKSLG